MLKAGAAAFLGPYRVGMLDLVVLASGGGDQMIPAAFDIASILVQLAIIIVVARAAGFAAGKVGIPPVVGEITAGVLLGPSLLGEELSRDLFPADTEPMLKLLASIGLVLFMFVVGLELDVSLVKGRGRVAGSVSVASIVLPFTMGIGLAALVLDDLRPDKAAFWPFALFIGAAMSITAFPVLARILTDRRMHRTETGGLALACAATDDVLAWTLLAVVIGIAGGDSKGPDWLVFLAVPFALVAIFVVRPALTVLTRMYAKAGELTPAILSIVLVGLLLFAAATEYLHVHFIFGAFLFGAVMPHEHAAAMRHEILVRLEQISVLLLLPVFFLVSGLQVDIQGLGTENILPLLAILAVAIVGKYVGAYLGARSAGVPHWQANALGILMNTRGLTELIILTVGLQLELLSRDLFTMMVIMALVTTVMTGPLLHFAYPARRINRDIAEAERAALGDAGLRPGSRDRAGGSGQPRAGRARRRAAEDEHPRPRRSWWPPSPRRPASSRWAPVSPASWPRWRPPWSGRRSWCAGAASWACRCGSSRTRARSPRSISPSCWGSSPRSSSWPGPTTSWRPGSAPRRRRRSPPCHRTSTPWPRAPRSGSPGPRLPTVTPRCSWAAGSPARWAHRSTSTATAAASSGCARRSPSAASGWRSPTRAPSR